MAAGLLSRGPASRRPVCLETGADFCRLGLPIEDCETLRNRVVWMVWVRWLIVAGALATVGLGALLFPWMALWPWLAADALALGLLNSLWHWWVVGGRRTICAGVLPLSSYQILTDFVLLAVAVHLTGGIGGPLTPLFVLHGVFSAVLLPKWHTAATLAAAATLMAASLLAEHWAGFLPPFRLGDPSVSPVWFHELVDAGFIVVATVGASIIGLDLSSQLRARHSRILGLAKELEERNDKLRQIDEQRLKLLGVASHDLRSPLAAIESRLDLFLNGYVGQVDDEQREQLAKMKERVGTLRGFLNDMLDLVAIQSAGPKMRPPVPLEIRRHLGAVVAEMSVVAERAGCEVETRLPEREVTVVAGPNRLQRVWTNLLSNAIKYGGGRPVVVEMVVRDGRVAVSFADRGMGIAPEDRPSLFSEYFRSRSAREAGIPGSGLGLAISKRVVESFGGSIEVESTLGEGTTFTVTLPVAPSSAEEPAAPRPSGAPAGSRPRG